MKTLARRGTALALAWVFTAGSVWGAAPIPPPAPPAAPSVAVPDPARLRPPASSPGPFEGEPAPGRSELPSATPASPAGAGGSAPVRLAMASTPLLAAAVAHGGTQPAALDESCDVAFYGPERFTRTRHERAFHDTIELPEGVAGPFVMIVSNGDPDEDAALGDWHHRRHHHCRWYKRDRGGPQGRWKHQKRRPYQWQHHSPKGRNRVSSAWIRIDGATVADPSDFSQQVDGFERVISLAPGENALEVEINDHKGSFITISICGHVGDQTPPALAIESPATGSSQGTLRPSLRVRYPDLPGPGEQVASGTAVETLVLRLDGGDVTASLTHREDESEGVPPEDLAEGLHVLSASVQDERGNAAEASVEFRVDVTPPQIAVAEPVDGSFWGAEPVPIRVDYADPGGLLDLETLRIEVGGVDRTASFAVEAGTAAAVTDAAWSLASGANAIVARIADAAGNTAQASGVFHVDPVPPSISISQPADGARLGTADVDVLVQFQDDQQLDLGSFEALLDGAPVALNQGAESALGVLAGLAEGAHGLEAAIRDAAGNEARVTSTFHVDTAVPSIEVYEPTPGGVVATATPQVVVVYSDEQGVDLETLRVVIGGVDRTGLFSVEPAAAHTILPASTALPDGEATIEAQIADHTGNLASVTSTVTVDTLGPTGALEAPGAFTNQVAPVVRWSYQDAGSGIDPERVRVVVDGVDRTAQFAVGPTEAVGVLATDPPLGDGTHDLLLTLVDKAGNSVDVPGDFVLDTLAPTAVVAFPGADSFVADPAPTVQLVFSDAGSGIAPGTLRAFLQREGAPELPVSAVLVEGGAEIEVPPTDPLADGRHSVRFEIEDAAGNVAEAVSAFGVDTVAPTLLVVAPSIDGYVATATPQIGLSYADEGSGVDAAALTLLVDGVDLSPRLVRGEDGAVATLLPEDALAEGEHVIEVALVDRAGNAAPVVPHPFFVDLTPPGLAVVSPAAGAFLGTPEPEVVLAFGDTALDLASLSVTVNGTDETASFAVEIDGATGTLGPLPDGPVAIAASVADLAGNGSTADVDFSIDTLPPSAEIALPEPDGFTNDPTPEIQLAFSDLGLAGVDPASAAVFVGPASGGVEVEITDSLSVTDLGATGEIPGIALPGDGSYLLRVELADRAGNPGQASAGFTLDTVPPQHSIDAPGADSAIPSATPNIHATYSESGSGLDPARSTLVVDGVDLSSRLVFGEGELTASLLAGDALGEGEHTVVLTVYDRAGNGSGTNPAHAFTVDTVAPDVSVELPAADTFVGTATPLLRVAYGDGPGSGIELSTMRVFVDGADVTSQLAPQESFAEGTLGTLLADGPHSVRAEAADRAGNDDSALISFTVDTTPPELPVLNPDDGLYTSELADGTLRVTGTIHDLDPSVRIDCRVGSVTVSAAVSGESFSCDVPLSEGENTLEIIATDSSGNSQTVRRTLNLDTVPPVVSVLEPMNDDYVSGEFVDVRGTVVDESPVSVSVADVVATVTMGTFEALGVPVGPGPEAVLQVLATDAAANSTDVPLHLFVDRDPPVVTIDDPEDGAFVSGAPILVSGTVEDASTVVVDVNGEMASVTGGTFTAQVPAGDGPHTLVATARDLASNTGSDQVEVTVDSAPPVITVITPEDGDLVGTTSVDVAGSVADASPVTLWLDGQLVPVTGNAFATQAPLPVEGQNTLELTARDAASNQTETFVGVRRDTLPPELSVVSPQEGDLVGAVPLPVSGTVADASQVGVSVNGTAATVTGGAWQADVAALSEGLQTLQVVATDEVGHSSSVQRQVTVDLGPPIVAISTPADGTLTSAASVLVEGSVVDQSTQSVTVAGVSATLNPGVPATFSAQVSLAEGDNTLVASATDALGRTGEAQVVVTRDSTPPAITLSAPDTITRGDPVEAGASVTDDVGVSEVVFELDGVELGRFEAAPYTVSLEVPEAAEAGDTLTLSVEATDTAGNVGVASTTVTVAADGVIVGRVLSDETGLPLAGAAAELDGGDAELTDERGRFSLPTGEAVAVVTVSQEGMVAVQRVVDVQTGVGTVPVDARLTPLAEPTVVAAGGDELTATLPGASGRSLTLTLPAGAVSAGAAVRLTPLSSQGLPGLLPLGWTPVAAFDLRLDGGANLALPGALTVSGLPDRIVHLVEYRPGTAAWHLVEPDRQPAGGELTLALPATGGWALVAADLLDTPLELPQVGSALEGTDMVELPADATGSGATEPPVIPPSGGTAVGRLSIDASVPLPSGTVLVAEVEESYELAAGDTTSVERRLHDIVFFRPLDEAAGPLEAEFPVTPSRSFGPTELVEGRVHLDVLAGRESVRGQVGGSAPVTVESDGVRLSVPQGSLAEDTAIAIQVAPFSPFLPSGGGLVPLGEVLLDFSGETLGLSAELSLEAGGVSQSDPLAIVRVVRIAGVPHLTVVALAELRGGRVVSKPIPGLPGVTQEGRYVFYRTTALGFLSGITTAELVPVSAVVSTQGLPFVALSRPDGGYTAVASPGSVTASARVPGTSLSGQASTSVSQGQTASLDIQLTGTVTTASVTPAHGAVAVPVTSPVSIDATAAMNPATIDGQTVRLLEGDPAAQAAVPLRFVLSASGRTLSVVPLQALAFDTEYSLVATAVADVFGGLVSVPQTTFRTRDDAPPVYDLEGLAFSFPDDQGLVQVTAPPGTFPPGTTVLIINAGNGVVVTFTALNDGSIEGQLPATIDDQLFITVTDPFGNVTTFTRSKFVAPDGTTAIGPGGGTVDGPGGIQLRIPEGALEQGVQLRIEPFGPELFAGEEPDLGTDANGDSLGSFGGGIRVDSPDQPTYEKEVDLAFPLPAGLPADPAEAFFHVFRRIEAPNGGYAYETIDHAFVEGEGVDARVVTASAPFPGYSNSIGQLTATGALSTGTNHFILFWTFDPTTLGQPLTGVVSGHLNRPLPAAPGSPDPGGFEPVAGAVVYLTELGGGLPPAEELAQFVENLQGEPVAFSQEDGSFTLWDPRYLGGTAHVLAQAPAPGTEIQTGVAYEINPQDSASPGLRFYRNVATVNLTFAEAAILPGPPPPLEIVVLRDDGTALNPNTSGLVLVGEPLVVGFRSADLTVTTATVNGADGTLQSVSPDVQSRLAPGVTLDLMVAESFTPDGPGLYTISATALPVFGGAPVSRTRTLRAIGSAGALDNLPGVPPEVISVLPLDASVEVSTSTVIEVHFSEPVVGVSPTSVVLRQGTAANNQGEVEIDVVGVGPDPDGVPRVIEDVFASPDASVVSLTIRPVGSLRFDTEYQLELTSQIQDLDENADGTPAPRPLVPLTSTFTTFAPQLLTGNAPATNEDLFKSTGIVALEDRVYVLKSDFINGRVVPYDVSDPARPTRVGTPGFLGTRPLDLVGQSNPPLIGPDGEVMSRVLVASAGATNVSRPSNVYVFDATTDELRWIGGASLTSGSQEGFITRTAIRGRYLYSATFNQGIQIVDLQRVIDDTPQPPANALLPEQGNKSFVLVFNSDGQGYGRQSVVRTIALEPSPSGQYVNDIDARPFSGVGQVMVAAAGAPGLVLANAVSGQRVYQGYPSSEDATLTWGDAVALGELEGLDVVVIAGLAMVTPRDMNGLPLPPVSRMVLLTVDGSDPSTILGFTALTDSGVDIGRASDLLLSGSRALVAGHGGSVMVSLEDLSRPTVIGAMPGLSGRLALASGGLIFSSAYSAVGGTATEHAVQALTLEPRGDCPLLTLHTPIVRQSYIQDPVNGSRCGDHGRVVFSLCRAANVSFALDGQYPAVGVDGGAPVSLGGASELALEAGTHTLDLIGPESLSQGSRQPFELRAVALQSPAEDATAPGEVVVDVENRSVLPVGHTFVKGVDLFDGHLVRQETDIRMAGRHLGLEVTRTYSSAGVEAEGILGAGWSWNYSSRLIPDRCGTWTVVTADGSSQVFSSDGSGGFVPQVGYHTRLEYDQPADTYVFTDKAGNRHVFREADIADPSRTMDVRRLDYIEEPHGDRVRIDYDGTGRVVRVVESLREGSGERRDARRLTIAYVTAAGDSGAGGSGASPLALGVGRIASITSSTGMRVEYEYDEWGNLERATRRGFNLEGQPQAEDWVQQYQYSVDDLRDRHQLLSVTEPNTRQVATEYVYYQESDTFPGEGEDPTDSGYLVLQKEERVRVVREHPGGGQGPYETGFEYDATRFQSERELEATVTDPRDYATRYVMNGNGSPLEIHEPGKERPTIIGWGADDPAETDILKQRETDPNGRVTEYDYDANGNLTLERILTEDFGPVENEYSYDPTFNKLTSKTDARDSVTTYDVDPVTGDLTRVEDAEGNVTVYTYDAGGLGLLEEVRDPRGYVTRYEDHDAYGNPRRVVDPLGNVTNRQYDGRGRMSLEFDSLGRRTEMDYDGFDRPTEVRRVAGGSSPDEVTVTVYYPAGQAETVTNAIGATTTFTLDGLNRVVQERTTGGRIQVPVERSYQYDGNGNRIGTTDGRGVVRRFEYDEVNRLRQEWIDAAGAHQGPVGLIAEHSYDDVGNKLTKRNALANLTTTFDYDDLYRVERKALPESDPGTGEPYEERFTYDLVGNLESSTDANGNTTEFDYDGLNRVVREENARGQVTTMTYEDVEAVEGQPSRVNRRERHDQTRGLRTTFEYDQLNRETLRLVHLEGPGGEGEILGTETGYVDAQHQVFVTDPIATVTRRQLDGLDRVVEELVDPGGLALRTVTTYDGLGNVTLVENPRRQPTSSVYDGLGRLLETRDARNERSTFTYDGEGRRTSETDRRQVRRDFTYDALGRPRTTTVTPSLTGVPWTQQTLYDDAGRRRTERDARDNDTVFELDGLDREVAVTDADGETLVRTYDGVNLRAERDKRENETLFGYDALNRLEQVTDPVPFAHQTEVTEYLDAENQRLVTDRRTIQELTQLDPLGRVVSVTRNGIRLELNDYDGNGNRLATTDAEGRVTAFAYDAANRMTARTDGWGTPEESTTSFSYDANGNLEEELDPRAQALGEPFSLHNTYDQLDRLATMEDGEGNVTQYGYDEEGNRTLVKEPEGQETHFDYDELGSLVRVVQPGNLETEYAYDANRNRVEEKDANRHVVELRYDKLNRLERRIQEGGLETVFDYDENGNETLMTDPKGQQVTSVYDELNRLRSKDYAFAPGQIERPWKHTERIEWDYDGNDNLTEVREFVASGTDPPGSPSGLLTTIRTYDDLDRLETEAVTLPDGGSRTVGYAYHDNGTRERVRDPDGLETSYTYDRKNRLATAVSSSGETTYQYTDDDLLSEVAYPNGVTATHSYDLSDRLESLANEAADGTVVSSYAYGYDRNGNRTTQTETNGGLTESTSYTYDDLNRLESVSYPADTAFPQGRHIRYTYDAVGNRERETIHEGADETGTVLEDKQGVFDSLNRLTALNDLLSPDPADDVSFTSDDNGNQTSKTEAGTTTTYLYGVRDKLLEVQQGAAIPARFQYDFEGKRSKKIGEDGITQYVYDQTSTLLEYDGNGFQVAKYDYGSDRLISQTRASGTQFYSFDALRSVTNLTDSFGTLAASYHLDTWGNFRFPEELNQSQNRFAFTGHLFDPETDFYYAKARYYDSEFGRFTTQDSFLGRIDEPPSLHRFAYANQNPLRYVDPTGHEVKAVGVDTTRITWDEYGNPRIGAVVAVETETVEVTAYPDRASAVAAELDVNLAQPMNRLATRGMGGVRVVGGGVQVVVGAAGLAAPEPMVTKVAGGVAIAHGVDDIQAGLRQLTTGVVVETLTGTAIRKGAEKAGASPETAALISAGGEFVIAAGSTGLAARGIPSPQRTTLGRITPEAQAAPRSGVEITLKRPAGVTDAQWQKKLDALNAGAVEGRAQVVHRPVRTGAAQRQARAEGRISPGDDADHALDLQFGGQDTPAEIISTNSTVNRSVGAQGRQRLRHPDGTPISRFRDEQ